MKPYDIEYKAKRRILRQVFKEFNKEYGFKFVRSSLLLRDMGDMIQYFDFHISPGRIIADIVVQPLYVPNDGFCVELSERIKRIGTPEYSRWGECRGSEDVYAEHVKDMLQIISSEGLKWFDKVSSPEKLIYEVEKPNYTGIFGPYPPAVRTKIIGLSYLYIGDTEHALPYLEEHINIFSEEIKGVSDYVIEHWKAVVEEYKEWVSMAKNHPERLKEQFEQIIADNRSKLKLDKISKGVKK